MTYEYMLLHLPLPSVGFDDDANERSRQHFVQELNDYGSAGWRVVAFLDTYGDFIMMRQLPVEAD